LTDSCDRVNWVASSDDNLHLLRDAVARRAGIVVSLPLPEGIAPGQGREAAPLRHYKSRFLDDAGDGLWVASVPAEADLIRQLVEQRYPVGVCFRSGQLKVMFATPLLHAQDDYGVSSIAGAAGATSPDGRTAVSALLLRFPARDDVRAVQRRRDFRVSIPPASDLQARVWLMPEDAQLRDKPSPRAELTCELRDISIGGLGVNLGVPDGRPMAVAAGDRLRIQLTLRDTSVVLEGRLRHPYKPVRLGSGTVRAGVQFKTLTDSRDDRQSLSHLNKIVTELQREAIRRRKLGVP
jgi:hypothetical protein